MRARATIMGIVLAGYRPVVQPWQHRWGPPTRRSAGPCPATWSSRRPDPDAPGIGPRVRELQLNRYVLSGDREGGSWCLALYPVARGCRLVSRWRVRWPLTPGTAFWILLSDPGAFLMERKVLKGIQARAARP